MLKPAKPPNEEQRLAELQAYDVLDTEEEAGFDGLASLAAHILGVPIALVSLVDESRQWFKAHYGLNVRETPRDLAFCAHVVADGEPMVVSDAHSDERFFDNPLVTGEPRVRFYAGFPLRTPAGGVLGTLCTIDHVPRTPSEDQLAMLRLLAAQVVAQLEARRRAKELAKERAAARAAVRRLEGLFDVMAEGVVVQGPDGKIIEANSSASTILGLSPDELHGRTSMDPRWRAVREDGSPFPGEDHPAMVALRTGEAKRNVVMGVCRPGAELGWISINALPRRDEDGSVCEVVTTFHDITTLRVATERLSQQERLAMAGTLAAGIGHEINNPLTYVMGNVDFAIEELRTMAGPSPSARLAELVAVLGEAREGAARIRKIVRGLKALAREDVALQGVSITNVVETSRSMASHEIRHRASVVEVLAEVPPVLADESRLTQVLVNLLVNAAQAFEQADPARNRITIAARLAPDGRVDIEVSDNGPGIAAALQRRVFDPFFTTKPVGQGTGLGLSVSRSIIDVLGGTLRLESTEGAGARFTISLPVAPAQADAVDGGEPLTAKRGRVLVIDDDASVLATIGRVLQREHEVQGCTSPLEAAAILERGERFDLILCDMAMPSLTGEQLFERVRRLGADVTDRFVFITGGVNDPSTRSFLDRVPNERVDKPFATQALLALARRFVGASAG